MRCSTCRSIQLCAVEEWYKATVAAEEWCKATVAAAAEDQSAMEDQQQLERQLQGVQSNSGSSRGSVSRQQLERQLQRDRGAAGADTGLGAVQMECQIPC